MTITQTVYEFPSFSLEKQLFYVTGAALEGGYTSGGARIVTPQPGGFGMLNVTPALQTNEWNYPLSSWLMSKTNGQILRIKLAPTPQICFSLAARSAPGIPWDTELHWDSEYLWDADLSGFYVATALQGSTTLQVDMSTFGRILQSGHVIGHKNSTYLVDDVSYTGGNIATIKVTPPLRANVAIGDVAFFRPFFTGMITNPTEVITPYDAGNNGTMQIPKILLSEVILP